VALDRLAESLVVAPSARAVAIAQDRIAEKSFLAAVGVPVGPWASVRDEADLEIAAAATGFPAIIKTARLGYDGKGQRAVQTLDDLHRAHAELGGVPCVVEAALDLDAELSVVAARTGDGTFVAFPVGENRHVRGILDTTVVPARIDERLASEAVGIARSIADALDYRGVLAVELFIVGGRLLVNEIAPRPHNSGHYTIDACRTSQFEQQVRVLCGLPLGDPSQHTPAVMVNLLGDIWSGGEPNWTAVLAHPGAHLHLYGKREARPGRKMGHVTICEDTTQHALEVALEIRAALGIGAGDESAPPQKRVQGR